MNNFDDFTKGKPNPYKKDFDDFGNLIAEKGWNDTFIDMEDIAQVHSKPETIIPVPWGSWWLKYQEF
ncbi:MAG: hypothetical protein ACR2PY_00940 [Salinispira sp.]